MLAIDETMIFRKYNPGNSSKYSIKLFKICDPDDYTYKVMVYTGKEKGASENDGRACDGCRCSGCGLCLFS